MKPGIAAFAGDARTRGKWTSRRNDCIATTGKIFGDGRMLEVVRKNGDPEILELAFWEGGEARLGPRFKCGGAIYEPAAIDPRMLQAFNFPRSVASTELPRTLLESITN